MLEQLSLTAEEKLLNDTQVYEEYDASNPYKA